MARSKSSQEPENLDSTSTPTYAVSVIARSIKIWLALVLGFFALTQSSLPFAKFSGEVSHGQNFEREFASGLLFRLAASRDSHIPGWTIEIRKKGDTNPDVELSSLVTPPYHFWNPRYVDVSYGLSAAESAAIRVRSFSFLRDPADFAKADAALSKVLWPNGISQEEVDRAMAALDAIPKCGGTMQIVDYRLAKDAATAIDRIDWLKFDVELCSPIQR